MSDTPSYGYCPYCGLRGISRERRPNGNDVCENNHTYPSAKAEQHYAPAAETVAVPISQLKNWRNYGNISEIWFEIDAIIAALKEEGK